MPKAKPLSVEHHNEIIQSQAAVTAAQQLLELSRERETTVVRATRLGLWRQLNRISAGQINPLVNTTPGEPEQPVPLRRPRNKKPAVLPSPAPEAEPAPGGAV